MITFAWPFMLLALPLPWLIHRWLPAQSTLPSSGLKVPYLQDFDHVSTEMNRTTSSWLIRLAALAWTCLILACCRPQWYGELIGQPSSGRELMMAVDVSGSMAQEDFEIQNQMVDRLTATKIIASDFLKQRSGDRIGLILFGTTAHIQTPLTYDLTTVSTLLNEAFIGITDDKPATSIGDAIGLAIKRLSDTDSDSRVLILLTDGANTAGQLTPLQAADLAQKKQLTIYTIGIGAEELIVKGFFGNQRINPSRDLDEATLKAIADKTGGQYFRARNTAELKQIYALLDQLEPIEYDPLFFRPITELYIWPMSMVLLMLFILIVIRMRHI
jgi:Ca-activated chloride channel family protein